VACPAESVEICQTLCMENGSSGLVEMISPEKGFTAYFASLETLFQCMHDLTEFTCAQDSTIHIKILEVESENWSEKWHAYFKPVKIGDHFIIHPPWEDPRCPDRRSIIINPGQAFGTGYHESTQLIVSLMEAVSLSRAVVADVGTGSGILAFCARSLGAERIVGLDIDFVAVREARKNAKLNRTDKVHWFTGSLDSMRLDFFDMILANVDFPTLSYLSPQLSTMTKQEGLLLISGFLQENVKELISSFAANGMAPICSKSLSGWAAMVLKKS